MNVQAEFHGQLSNYGISLKAATAIPNAKWKL